MLPRRSTALAVSTGAAVVLAVLALLLATSEGGLDARGRWVEPSVERAEDGGLAWRAAWPFLLEDWYDRLAYAERGRWIASGGRPYLDVFSEYPQIATWLMGVPYLLFEDHVTPGEPFGTIRRSRAALEAQGVPSAAAAAAVPIPGDRGFPRDEEVAALVGPHRPRDPTAVGAAVREARAAVERRNAELEVDRRAYGDRHHVLMALWFVALLALTAGNLRLLGRSPWWALLLLLPSSLYFAFNRFDLVVTAFVALAIHLQLRGRLAAAGLALGLAAMTKWYPLVLLPLFLSHGARSLAAAGEPGRRAFLRGIAAPGAAFGLVCAAVLGATLVLGGGVEAVRAPFEWHASVRVPNQSSLLSLLVHRWELVPPDALSGLGKAFKVLQLAPGFLLALLPIHTPRRLLAGALVATLCTITFSQFFSPQWVLWSTALVALLAPGRRELIALAVALEVLTYLQLPVFHFHSQATGEAAAYWMASNLRAAALLLLLGAALWAFLREGRRGPAPSAARARPAG